MTDDQLLLGAIALAVALVLGLMVWAAMRRAKSAKEAAAAMRRATAAAEAAAAAATATATAAAAKTAETEQALQETQEALAKLKKAAPAPKTARAPKAGARPRSGISRPASGPSVAPSKRPAPSWSSQDAAARDRIRLASVAVRRVVRGPKRAGNRAGFFPPDAPAELDDVARALEQVLSARMGLAPEQAKQIDASLQDVKRARATFPDPSSKHTHMPNAPCRVCDTTDAVLATVRSGLSKSLAELGADSDTPAS